MKRNLLVLPGALGLLAVALPSAAQPRPGQAELPVTQVVLFSSGVGYFQRDGQVDGHARIDLLFPQADINDLLKSLVLQDLGGGQVAPVTYDNRNPLEMTLKSFALDLTRNPTMADLLNQARGEKAEVVTTADNRNAVATVGQAETLTGVIVGVEKQRQPHGKDQVVETAQLNLLTADGLRGVPMAQVQRVRFLKASLEQEFRKALEALAAGHDKQKKTVSLSFTGEGKRQVRVGYVTESPLWKTSYRLALDKDKVFLQGWAVVENTTDEDWVNVQLGLVSGRPISFRMDLYEPLFVARPLIEPELFASLRPQTYGGDLDRDESRRADGKGEGRAGGEGKGKSTGAGKPGGLSQRRQAGFGEGADKEEAQRGLLMDRPAESAKKMNFRESVASAASATELGEYFEYHIRQPVSLPRQKSALIPIVNQPVGGTKVSIYNQAVHAKFPLLGLRFKNTTDLHLCQGPITVFENDAYAGDARISDLQPKEERLLSYAIDLGTEVEPQQTFAESLQAVKVVKGILEATFKQREAKTYTVKNRSPQARTVLVEHPYRAHMTLVTPQKASERTREVYRFELAAEPNKPVSLEVVEETPRVQQFSLSNSDDETVRVFLRATVTSVKAKKALEEALALKLKVGEAKRQAEDEERALAEIEKDQARMRANLKEVPIDSEAHKRYVKKFDAQETEIERRQAQLVKLREQADKLRKEYDAFLAGLTIEG